MLALMHWLVLNPTFRAKIQARVAKEPGLRLLFLESLCDDPAVIAANVELKVSMGDPDYAGMSKEDARADFLRRIRQYEDSYEPIAEGEAGKGEERYSYLKVINVGNQVAANHIHGYLQSRIAYYLMNLHLRPRSIYFSRVSEIMTSLSPLSVNMPNTHCPNSIALVAWRKSVQRGRKNRGRCAAL